MVNYVDANNNSIADATLDVCARSMFTSCKIMYEYTETLAYTPHNTSPHAMSMLKKMPLKAAKNK